MARIKIKVFSQKMIYNLAVKQWLHALRKLRQLSKSRNHSPSMKPTLKVGLSN